jgi:lysozyme
VTNNIHVPLTQNQFDALVAMGYNVPSAFTASTPPRRPPSTLRTDLNAGNYDGAADQMLRWDMAGKPPRVMGGLKGRRTAERNIFLNGIYTNHSVNGH